VKKSVLAANKLSFTTDTWTEGNTTKAFIGVSVHWIDSQWDRKFAVLNCEEFSARHSGDMIAEKFETVLAAWNIPKESCHLVLRDNAANMVRAFQHADIPSLGCSLHTLQLAIHDCIFDQRAVSDALAVCRRLVGHFKHSALASHRLKEIQQELQCDVLRPVQDVSTRWNSTYYMVERLLKIKRSVSVFCAETEGMQDKSLTPNMWSLLENVKILLELVEKLTRDLSSYDACLSAVIPAVLGLKLTLESDNRDVGVKTMKAGLIAAIDERFDPVIKQETATTATALDPRFKLVFFKSDTVRTTVRSTVLNKALMLPQQSLACQSESAVAAPPPSCADLTSMSSTASNQTHEYSSGSGDVWTALAHLAGGAVPSESGDLAVTVSAEVATYFSQSLLPINQNPLTWWQVNKHCLPTLAQLALVYLSPPPSSVQSERIFSLAGEVYDDHRSRLMAENAERLVFLKFNLPLLNYKY